MNDNSGNSNADPSANVHPVKLQILSTDYSGQKDEINLYELIQVLLRYKIYLVVITVVCTSFALFYSLSLPPVYKAELYVSPPDERDVVGLSVREGSSPQWLFKRFLKTLDSRLLRWQFFEKNDLVSKLIDKADSSVNPLVVFDTQFNQLLSYEIPDKKKNRGGRSSDVVVVRLLAKDAELAASWLNDFAEFANTETVASVKKDIEVNLIRKKNEVKDEMRRLRLYTKKLRLDEIQRLAEADNVKREKVETNIQALKRKSAKDTKDKIATLSESLKIAETLGIEQPTLMASTKSINSPELTVNLQEMPAYTRGTNALTAELEAVKERENKEAFIAGLRDAERDLELLRKNPVIISLENRKSDDPYIDNLRNLESSYEHTVDLIKQVVSDTSVRAAIIEQYAIVPDIRVSPNRKLIVLVGLLIGLSLGIFVVSILSILDRVRAGREEE